LHYQFAFLKDFIPVKTLDQARQDFSDMKDNKLSYNFNYNPGVTDDSLSSGSVNVKLNAGMMIFEVLLLLACGGAAIWIYNRETPGIVFEVGASFIPIGGWLILILIGLFITPLNIIDVISKANFFSLHTWNLYAHKAGEPIFRSLLTWEVFGNTIVLCYSIFCLVLLLNKRDILPKAIIGYFMFCLVFTLVDYILAINLKNDAMSEMALMPLLRSLVVGAIWIPYFIRSVRVHQTFVVPYPPHNFSYEKPG
jgi:hypothetical protein